MEGGILRSLDVVEVEERDRQNRVQVAASAESRVFREIQFDTAENEEGREGGGAVMGLGVVEDQLLIVEHSDHFEVEYEVLGGTGTGELLGEEVMGEGEAKGLTEEESAAAAVQSSPAAEDPFSQNRRNQYISSRPMRVLVEQQGVSIAAASREVGISRVTAYKYLAG